MTEKRFTMMYGKYIDNENNIEYDEKWESWKICELLNELSEENNELHIQNTFLKHKLFNSKIQSVRELRSVRRVKW